MDASGFFVEKESWMHPWMHSVLEIFTVQLNMVKFCWICKESASLRCSNLLVSSKIWGMIWQLLHSWNFCLVSTQNSNWMVQECLFLDIALLFQLYPCLNRNLVGSKKCHGYWWRTFWQSSQNKMHKDHSSQKLKKEKWKMVIKEMK